jgi:phage tail sheath protein FI
MAFERPGVYVREVPSQTQITPQNTATAAAFVGTALRGPNSPILINSWSAYVSNFGPLSNDYELGYAVYNYFANGGRDAYVTRVVGNSIAAATFATAPLPTNTTATPPVAGTLFTLTAKSAGVWATNTTGQTDGLQAEITFDPATLVTGAAADTVRIDKNTLFSLSLKYKGAEIERWQELSLDPDSGRYVRDVLSLFSTYVDCSTPTTIATGSSLVVATGADTALTIDFSTAINGGAPDETSYDTAIKKYDGIKVPLVINFVGQTDAVIVSKAVNYASTRGDCFVIVDCEKNADAATVSTQVTNLLATGISPSYAGVYFPALRLADPARSGPAAIRTCFAGGVVAGAFIRSENTRGVAKAPAGYSLDLRNVFGLSVTTTTEAQEASLYNTKNVNVIRSIPGGTFIINGARTLATVRPEKFVPVRRTLNYLKSSLENQTGFAVFEPNDSRLWDKIKNRLSANLTGFWAAGNLKGSSADQAFYIICDESNNTTSTINDGFVNIEVGVSLLNPAEFVIINISQWAGETAL